MLILVANVGAEEIKLPDCQKEELQDKFATFHISLLTASNIL